MRHLKGSGLVHEVFGERELSELSTGNIAIGHVRYSTTGGGKIFVYDVEDVMKIRTGESGYDALQDNA